MRFADHNGRKLLVWTGIPTHHQSGFFAALRAQGVDLQVHYFKRVSEQRQRHGWADPATLPADERYVSPVLESLEQCADWRERIHIIPGYATSFLLKLANALSSAGVPWLHWSEPSRPTLKSILTYPVKRYYGSLVNRSALGALAIGECARRDFRRWGIREEKIRFLPYSIPAPTSQAVQDETARPAPAPYDPARPDSAPRDPAPSGGVRPDAATPPRFLFVGALCSRKGVDVLLHAFRRVLVEFPDARLELVGYDEANGQYTRLSEQLRITNAVHFTGSIPAAQIATAFERCDVFVLPSRFDGWGVVLNEAAALGKALISTDSTGAAHHLIAQGRNGYRVPSEDAQALASVMLEYCRRPELAAIHGAESRVLFADFTPERNATRLRDAVSSLLTSAAAGSVELDAAGWHRHSG